MDYKWVNGYKKRPSVRFKERPKWMVYDQLSPPPSSSVMLLSMLGRKATVSSTRPRQKHITWMKPVHGTPSKSPLNGDFKRILRGFHGISWDFKRISWDFMGF